jgi:branched-chain amino acid transport system permease protein
MHDALSVAMRASHVLAALFVAAALVFALVAASFGDVFYLRLATEALMFGGLALSVDLLLGYTGLLSLGQALYFGLGAYVSALVLIATASFWLALGAAFCAGLLAGCIGGVIANRVRGVYFALITFGMAQVIAKIIYNTRALGASDGLIGVPVLELNLGLYTLSSASPAGLFLFVLALTLALYAAVAYLLETPFGRLLIATRVNEQRVAFLGYSTVRLRFASFVLAAAVASVFGALYPVLRGFVAPELLFFSTSGDALIVLVIGGVGTLVGALYGSFILVMLKSVIGSWTEHHLIFIGLLFMATVIALPGGIIGLLRRRIIRQIEPKTGVS